jgi:hypothetical protein
MGLLIERSKLFFTHAGWPKTDQRLAVLCAGWNVHKQVWSNYAERSDNSIGLNHGRDVIFLASDAAADLGSAQTNGVRGQLRHAGRIH